MLLDFLKAQDFMQRKVGILCTNTESQFLEEDAHPEKMERKIINRT